MTSQLVHPPRSTRRVAHHGGTGQPATATAIGDHQRDAFFTAVTDTFPAPPGACSVLITHVLAGCDSFVRAVDRQAPIAVLLPKPASITTEGRAHLADVYRVDTLTRQRFRDPTTTGAYLDHHAGGRPIILLDIGGYFAPVLTGLRARFSGRLLGVVEDTENGHRRYLNIDSPPCPIISVARSPLKRPEDHLVGQAIVFSTEAILRGRADILPGRRACVIGYGKLGQSITAALHARHVQVTVFDDDPVQVAHALAHGFPVNRSCTDALYDASVVICATGNHALRDADFDALHPGACVVSVTSADDELHLDHLNTRYRAEAAGPHLTHYTAAGGHHFYLAHGGNAINFLHGSVVGPFIYLVQAEILAAMAHLRTGGTGPGVHTLDPADRRTIARLWLDHFTPEHAR